MSAGLELAFAMMFDNWEWHHWLAYCVAVFIGMGAVGQLLQSSILFGCWGTQKMPFKGRVHDLTASDYMMISSSKAITCMYLYHSVLFYRSADWICSGWDNLAVANTVGVLLAGLGLYDLFYVPFHRALHIPALYPHVHKHHHRQINPYRAINDAVNVHPFEFISGEYLHMLVMWILGQYILPAMGHKMHIAGLILFLIYTGLCAQINHTRWIVHIPFMYDTRTHDIHHKFPRSNYCQYVPWWDHFYGSFIPYGDDILASARRKGVAADDALTTRNPSVAPERASTAAAP